MSVERVSAKGHTGRNIWNCPRRIFFSIRHNERTISTKGQLVQQQLAGTNTLSSLLKIVGRSLLSFLCEEMVVCSPNCPVPCRGLFSTRPHPHRQGQASLLLLTNEMQRVPLCVQAFLHHGLLDDDSFHQNSSATVRNWSDNASSTAANVISPMLDALPGKKASEITESGEAYL